MSDKKKSEFLLGVEYERRLRAIEDHLAEEEKKRLDSRLGYVESYHAYLKKAMEDLPELDMKRQAEHVDWLQDHLEKEIRRTHNRLWEKAEVIEKKFKACVAALSEGEE